MDPETIERFSKCLRIDSLDFLLIRDMEVLETFHLRLRSFLEVLIFEFGLVLVDG